MTWEAFVKLVDVLTTEAVTILGDPAAAAAIHTRVDIAPKRSEERKTIIADLHGHVNG